MKFNIITLFPKMFESPLSESIIKRAQTKGLVDVNLINLRDFATDKHNTIDDTSYGGGAGMVLKVDVMDRAIFSLKNEKKKIRKILLSPKGKLFTQKTAIQLSKYDELILIAGHYEGFDQRIHDNLIDEEISIGEYVLTGGELPAMVLIDAVSRMVPGVIKKESRENESFISKDSKYDYPVYTKPAIYKGWKVPDILISGNHKEIDAWRKKNS